MASSDNPFNDNPFAVGSSVTEDTSRPTGGGWAGAGNSSGAWGSSPPQTTYNNAVAAEDTPIVAPTTIPTSMGVIGSSSMNNKASSSSAREKDLDKREAALNRKEAELKRLETELRNNPGAARRKNWPIWCSIVYHNIKEDIPENLQWTMRTAYFAYLGLLVCLVWNFIGCCGAWITDGSIAAFLWGSLYVVGGVPGAWFLWYGRLYRAMMKDSAFGYGLFFLFFTSAHLIFTAWSAIAPPIINSWSHVGFWVGAQEVSQESSALAVLYYIGGGLWSAEFLWSFWTLKKVYWAFRGAGHSAGDVKRDAARSAVASSV